MGNGEKLVSLVAMVIGLIATLALWIALVIAGFRHDMKDFAICAVVIALSELSGIKDAIKGRE